MRYDPACTVPGPWFLVLSWHGMRLAVKDLAMKETRLSINMTKKRVELREIEKRYPGVVANQGVSCDLIEGEIHAVLGENGAGKTTLMNILAGLERPDSGRIIIEGREWRLKSPRDARRAGIGMVHQHFSLVPALTVAENLALSRPEGASCTRPSTWTRHLREQAKRYGIEIRPDARVSGLSMGERQRVEILRLLLEDARVLILDEPTSILAPHEADLMFQQMLALTKEGRSVFLVTHKIEHIFEFADRVTVLRKGQKVGTHMVSDLDPNSLASLMVGYEIEPSDLAPDPPGDFHARVVLKAENLGARATRSVHHLRDVSFELRAGEILGIAGVAGNGQDELASAAAGMMPHDGEVYVADGIEGMSGSVGFIPSDRLSDGLAASLSVRDNLVIHRFRQATFRMGPFLRQQALDRKALRLVESFGVRPEDPDARISSLSGGNRQKVLLAREIDRAPSVLVAATPTAGLDFATVDFVHSELRRMASAGCGVILLSEDLDEIMNLCHRILVLFEGRVVGEFTSEVADRHTIGLLMSGIVPNTNEEPCAVKLA